MSQTSKFNNYLISKTIFIILVLIKIIKTNFCISKKNAKYPAGDIWHLII